MLLTKIPESSSANKLYKINISNSKYRKSYNKRRQNPLHKISPELG
jgi:hypothetical protein